MSKPMNSADQHGPAGDMDDGQLDGIVGGAGQKSQRSGMPDPTASEPIKIEAKFGPTVAETQGKPNVNDAFKEIGSKVEQIYGKVDQAFGKIGLSTSDYKSAWGSDIKQNSFASAFGANGGAAAEEAWKKY